MSHEREILGDIDRYLPNDTESEPLDNQHSTQVALNAFLHAISLSKRDYCIEYLIGGVKDEINSEQLRSAREMDPEEKFAFIDGKAEELFWADSIIIRSSSVVRRDQTEN